MAKELGRVGGSRTHELHPEHLKNISKLGVLARLKRKNEAKDKLDKPNAR